MKDRTRYPRTLQEAFGPYAHWDTPRTNWREIGWWIAAGIAFVLLLVIIGAASAVQ